MSFNSRQTEGAGGRWTHRVIPNVGPQQTETPFITLQLDNTNPNWYLPSPWLLTSRRLACVGWARFGILEVWVSVQCGEQALYKLGSIGTTNHNDSDNSTYQDSELQVKYFYQVYQREIWMMSRSFWHLQWGWSGNEDHELDCLEWNPSRHLSKDNGFD